MSASKAASGSTCAFPVYLPYHPRIAMPCKIILSLCIALLRMGESISRKVKAESTGMYELLPKGESNAANGGLLPMGESTGTYVLMRREKPRSLLSQRARPIHGSILTSETKNVNCNDWNC